MPIAQVPSPLTSILYAKMYNAAWFPGNTVEAQVQNAINAAVTDGADAVFVPANLLPLNNSLLVYNANVAIFYENLNLIGPDRGDNNVTLVLGTDFEIQRFNTTLTANRTVTLPTGHKGARFRVIRTALGEVYTLNVGGLASLTASGGWVDVIHNGTAWIFAGSSEQGGSGGGSGLDVGTDPFVAQVETVGDASHPPFAHLSNPGGSGKFLVVRKLKVWATAAQVIKIRRTSTPLATGGSVTSDTPVRMNEVTGGSPVGVLEACTAHGGTIFTRAESQWQFPILNENAGALSDVLKSTDFPIWVVPGSALEFALDANSATNVIRVHVIWDEVV
jgi:hypothetical protein